MDEFEIPPHLTVPAKPSWKLESGGVVQFVDEATMRAFSQRLGRFSNQADTVDFVVSQMWAEIDRIRKALAEKP
jgi:hypothetical protein